MPRSVRLFRTVVDWRREVPRRLRVVGRCSGPEDDPSAATAAMPGRPDIGEVAWRVVAPG